MERITRSWPPLAERSKQYSHLRDRALAVWLHAAEKGGYQSISMSAVARICGVTQPAVLYHFGTVSNWNDACFEYAKVKQSAIVLRQYLANGEKCVADIPDNLRGTI
jgi:AcrR family transcriptional regulator